MEKYMFVYNPYQAEFFLNEGCLSVETGRGFKGDSYVKFLRDSLFEQTFRKWCSLSNPKSNSIEEFRTNSLNLAAWLESRDCQMIRCEKNGEVNEFFFANTEAVQKEVRNYKENRDLRNFLTSFRNIKERTKVK